MLNAVWPSADPQGSVNVYTGGLGLYTVYCPSDTFNAIRSAREISPILHVVVPPTCPFGVPSIQHVTRWRQCMGPVRPYHPANTQAVAIADFAKSALGYRYSSDGSRMPRGALVPGSCLTGRAFDREKVSGGRLSAIRHLRVAYLVTVGNPFFHSD